MHDGKLQNQPKVEFKFQPLPFGDMGHGRRQSKL